MTRCAFATLRRSPTLRAMLTISRTLAIPDTELVERFLRADGPGGQHVNRTESAVELRFDVARSPSLPDAVRERLLRALLRAADR